MAPLENLLKFVTALLGKFWVVDFSWKIFSHALFRKSSQRILYGPISQTIYNVGCRFLAIFGPKTPIISSFSDVEAQGGMLPHAPR